MSGFVRVMGVVGLVLAVAPAGHADASPREHILLHENWRLRSAADFEPDGPALASTGYDDGDWLPTRVPATVLTALVEAGVYPDPYYGDNLARIPGYKPGPRQIHELAMPEDSPFRAHHWYRTEFFAPEHLADKEVLLTFDGISYEANIWLNGRLLGTRDDIIGMFRRFEFPVNGILNFGGQNALAVELIAASTRAEIDVRTKQTEAATAWDDHNPLPPDRNMGIWRDVYLEATGPVRLRRPFVHTALDVPSLEQARLTVSVDAENLTDESVTAAVRGSIEGYAFERTVTLGPKESATLTFAPGEHAGLIIDAPRVWWPNNLGPQEFYFLDLAVEVEGQPSDTDRVRFGIRHATTYINEDGWRGYQVNGRNILIRGGAWMTNDMLLRLERRNYEALLRYAKELGFNMLRSEGFSIREGKDFFDLCDEYGIMVTQQIFGRSIPDEDLAIDTTRQMILRIRNHPSLVHFLGHDETFPTESLEQTYRGMIERYMPGMTFQRHSGGFRLEDRFETGGTRTGSRELWTYAYPARYYARPEFGASGFAQSGGIGGTIAPMESMRKMMDAGDMWPPFTETWSLRTVVQGGEYFRLLVDSLNARYGEATGIEDFTWKGLAMNYASARGMFEAYGRNKYDALGITTWKYNSAWPASPTWQYVDWYLQPNGAYFGAKQALRPLIVQYSYDDHSVWVVNSYYENFEDLSVSATVYNLDLSERMHLEETVRVDADGKTKVFDLAWPDGLTTTFFLDLRMTFTRGGEEKSIQNFYWLSTVPDVPGGPGPSSDPRMGTRLDSHADHTDLQSLPVVALNASHAVESMGREQRVTVTVENPTEHLAFFIQLAVTRGEGGPEITPAFWEDNYFSLLPGERRTVEAVVWTDDLEGAEPALRVDGWNVRIGG